MYLSQKYAPFAYSLLTHGGTGPAYSFYADASIQAPVLFGHPLNIFSSQTPRNSQPPASMNRGGWRPTITGGLGGGAPQLEKRLTFFIGV